MRSRMMLPLAATVLAGTAFAVPGTLHAEKVQKRTIQFVQPKPFSARVPLSTRGPMEPLHMPTDVGILHGKQWVLKLPYTREAEQYADLVPGQGLTMPEQRVLVLDPVRPKTIWLNPKLATRKEFAKATDAKSEKGPPRYRPKEPPRRPHSPKLRLNGLRLISY